MPRVVLWSREHLLNALRVPSLSYFFFSINILAFAQKMLMTPLGSFPGRILSPLSILRSPTSWASYFWRFKNVLRTNALSHHSPGLCASPSHTWKLGKSELPASQSFPRMPVSLSQREIPDSDAALRKTVPVIHGGNPSDRTMREGSLGWNNRREYAGLWSGLPCHDGTHHRWVKPIVFHVEQE